VKGLELLLDEGYEYSWKIRSDFKIENLEALTSSLIESIESSSRKVYFLDWVLHRSGYPMDFIQFGKTVDLLNVWKRVATAWPPNRSPEERLKTAFAKNFASKNPDKNPWKSIGFMANRAVSINGVDITWLKAGVSLKQDWVGNPVFVQMSDGGNSR
jgi:hypothetical protein